MPARIQRYPLHPYRRLAIIALAAFLAGYAAGRTDASDSAVNSSAGFPPLTTSGVTSGSELFTGAPIAPSRSAVPPVELTPAAERSQPTAPAASVPGTMLEGTATWYCLPGRSPCTAGYPASGMFAAAGPALRTGDWRGAIVEACLANDPARCVRVKLIDSCACPDGAIDLYAAAFAELAPLSRGVIAVTVELGA